MKTKKILESDYERYVLDRAKHYGYNRIGLCAALGISLGTLKARLAGRRDWRPAECRRLAEVLHLTDIELLHLTYYGVPLSMDDIPTA